MSRHVWRATAVTVCVLFLTAGTAVANTNDSTTVCREATVPVTVGGSHGVIAGTLCIPPQANNLQILIHGYTYNRHYWDPGVNAKTNSYAADANAAGYATFAIDRMGSGTSIAPLSLFATFQSDVDTLHRVVQSARNGDLGHPFNKVLTVGHSLGSVVATAEAGAYNDVDAIVTTGYSHNVNSAYAFPTILGRDYLAVGDEAFAERDLDALYLTSIPGTRGAFYETNNTDSNMIQHDEDVMRDTTSLIEFVTAVPVIAANPNTDTNVPVMVVNGEHEPFFCGAASADCTNAQALAQSEAGFYGADATVSAHVAANGGHNVALEATAPAATAAMLAFADKHVGAGDAVTGTARGQVPQPVDHDQSRSPLVARTLNSLLSAGVKPITDTVADTVDPLPGAGDGYDPIPLAAEARRDIANLHATILGDAPQHLLSVTE